MNKRRPWFKTVLLLAMTLGIAVLWFVDSWLTPKPEIFHLNELLSLPKKSWNNYYLLHDVNLNYLCLLPRPGIAGEEDGLVINLDNDVRERMIQKFPHFDLFPKQLQWSQPREKSFRMVYCDQAGHLTVQDVFFLQSTIKIVELGTYEPEQILDVQIANEGETIVVIREIPLWTLETLLPFGGMFPSSMASPFKVFLAETWDLASHKIISRATFPSSPSHHFKLSPDGCWLVQREGTLTSTDFRSLDTQLRFKQATLERPVLPRGLMVMETKTGMMKRISTIPVEDEYSTFNLRIMGHKCFIKYERVGGVVGGGTLFGGRLKDEEKYRCYDLFSGESLPWNYCSEYRTNRDIQYAPLNLPSGSIQSSIFLSEWPEWLRKLLLSIKIDIEEYYPRGGTWMVTCYDERTGKETATLSAFIPGCNEWELRHTYASNYLYRLFTYQDQLSFYRWKVPFTIYSPGWSRAAGLLAALCILVCYWLLISRRQKKQVTPPTPHAASPPHSPAP
ncbi:MAG: hypothetical protein QM703_27870 [Gemmatales bacterium]